MGDPRERRDFGNALGWDDVGAQGYGNADFALKRVDAQGAPTVCRRCASRLGRCPECGARHPRRLMGHRVTDGEA